MSRCLFVPDAGATRQVPARVLDGEPPPHLPVLAGEERVLRGASTGAHHLQLCPTGYG